MYCLYSSLIKFHLKSALAPNFFFYHIVTKFEWINRRCKYSKCYTSRSLPGGLSAGCTKRRSSGAEVRHLASFMTFGLKNNFSEAAWMMSHHPVGGWSLVPSLGRKMLNYYDRKHFQILSNTKHLFPNLPVLLCLGNMASWQSFLPSCHRTLTVCWTFAPPDEKSVEPFGDCGDPRRISFWAVFRCQEKCSWNKKVNKCVVMLSENSNGTVMHTALCHKRVMQAIMMIWYWLSWYMDPWGRGTVSLCQAETLVHFLSLSLFCLDSFQLFHCWGDCDWGKLCLLLVWWHNDRRSFSVLQFDL